MGKQRVLTFQRLLSVQLQGQETFSLLEAESSSSWLALPTNLQRAQSYLDHSLYHGAQLSQVPRHPTEAVPRQTAQPTATSLFWPRGGGRAPQSAQSAQGPPTRREDDLGPGRRLPGVGGARPSGGQERGAGLLAGSALAPGAVGGAVVLSPLLASVRVGTPLPCLFELAGPRGGEFQEHWGEDRGSLGTRRGWGGEDWGGGGEKRRGARAGMGREG